MLATVSTYETTHINLIDISPTHVINSTLLMGRVYAICGWCITVKFSQVLLVKVL